MKICLKVYFICNKPTQFNWENPGGQSDSFLYGSVGKVRSMFRAPCRNIWKNIVFCYDRSSTRLFCLSKGFRFSSTTWVEIRVLVFVLEEHTTNFPAIATRTIVIAAFIFLGLNLFMQNRLIVQS
jgi:hypothetical protein